MATVTRPPQVYKPTDTDRRVRHPLQALRGYIRTYVLIEGLMIAIIFLALWFWIGLALDFGAFAIFPIRQEAQGALAFGGFDWIQALQWASAEGQDTAWLVRVVLLSLLGVCLVGLVAYKVLLRLFVDFRDTALALVLERRFPQKLGDRLITAVEMADPKLAEKYGLSRAMIEKTINEAAERVEQVPVNQVFNWGRLRRLTLTAAGLTLGLYMLLWAIFIGTAAALRAADTPTDFFYRFNHVAGIWAERNLLIKDSYWPRQAHLEIIRFQDTASNPGEMRVGRDESRPDIQVRGVRWVIADRAAPEGWRALRWSDLPNLGDPELARLANTVALPGDFPAWVIDLSDLNERVAPGMVPAEWQGKTRGDIAKLIHEAEFQNTLDNLGKERAVVEAALRDLLDWKTWSIDKLQLQEARTEVRLPMKEMHPKAHAALEKVLAYLESLSDEVYMERTLRQLEVPDRVQVYYYGKKTKSSSPQERLTDNKYTIGLGELTESVEFTVRGADFYTRPRKITLVPPPTVVSLKIDKEEPAYIYHRVQGDQAALRGKKQLFKDVSISISGDSSVIQVPLGTNITLTAVADRELKDGILVGKSGKPKAGSSVPLIDVRLQSDKRSFTTRFDNIVRAYDFQFEFLDEDNVRGRRRILIEPVDDRPPDVNLELDPGVVLRKPSQQKGPRSADADGLLVTPDALIPFKGMVRDDYGLTDVQWLFQVKQVDVELSGGATGQRADELSLVVSGMQFGPTAAVVPAAGSLYWTWVTTILKANQATARPATEEATPLEVFRARLQSVDEVPITALAEHLKKKPQRRQLLREHNVGDESGFDFSRYLSRLKVRDAAREAQQHYLVKLFVNATDNNVETGPGSSRSSKVITFLVVSENELLSQIFIEEENLRERLEKVIQRLADARTALEEQVSKLSITNPQLSLVAIRLNETGKTVGDSASLTREIHRDYRRILRELEVNRVKPQKINEVQFDIVEPLGRIIAAEPEVGNFTTTEDAIFKVYAEVDADAGLLAAAEDGKEPPLLLDDLEANRAKHLQGAREARDNLGRLIERLQAVLDAMEEGTTYGRLLQLLVSIERDQREAANRLELFHRQEVDRVLKSLFD